MHLFRYFNVPLTDSILLLDLDNEVDKLQQIKNVKSEELEALTVYIYITNVWL
jgi:hypothetical protein